MPDHQTLDLFESQAAEPFFLPVSYCASWFKTLLIMFRLSRKRSPANSQPATPFLGTASLVCSALPAHINRWEAERPKPKLSFCKLPSADRGQDAPLQGKCIHSTETHQFHANEAAKPVRKYSFTCTETWSVRLKWISTMLEKMGGQRLWTHRKTEGPLTIVSKHMS